METREYLARRGGAWFSEEQLVPARSSLLGYALKNIMVEGSPLDRGLLQVEKQGEVGEEAYDKGNQILQDFFHEHLEKFLEDDLMDKGKKIIECCLDNDDLEDYISLIDSEPIIQSQ